MVVDLGAIKDGDWCTVQRDIAAVVQAAGAEVLVKVILETCLLTDEEIVQACECAQEAGADFVKTFHGFLTIRCQYARSRAYAQNCWLKNWA